MNKDDDADFQPIGRRKIHQSQKASKASFAIPESVNNMLGSVNMTAQTEPKRLQALQKFKDSKKSQGYGVINLTSQTEPNRFQPRDVFTINKAAVASMHTGAQKNLDNIADIAESSKDNSILNLQEPLLKEPLLKEPFQVPFPNIQIYILIYQLLFRRQLESNPRHRPPQQEAISGWETSPGTSIPRKNCLKSWM